jgi:hypothetical protein
VYYQAALAFFHAANAGDRADDKVLFQWNLFFYNKSIFILKDVESFYRYCFGDLILGSTEKRTNFDTLRIDLACSIRISIFWTYRNMESRRFYLYSIRCLDDVVVRFVQEN